MSLIIAFEESDVACAVCLEVVDKAVSCDSCNQLFCSACVTSLEYAESDSCPNCRSEPFETTRNVPIDRLLGKLIWDCEECGATMQRAEKEDHLRSACPITSQKRAAQNEAATNSTESSLQRWFPNLKYGMSHTEVARLVGENASWEFNTLPIADEVTNFQCRYFWKPLHRTGANQVFNQDFLNLIGREGSPYICFLFHPTRGLNNVSVRSFDPTMVERFISFYRIVRNPNGSRLARDQSDNRHIIWIGRINIDFADRNMIPINGNDYL